MVSADFTQAPGVVLTAMLPGFDMPVMPGLVPGSQIFGVDSALVKEISARPCSGGRIDRANPQAASVPVDQELADRIPPTPSPSDRYASQSREPLRDRTLRHGRAGGRWSG